MGVVVLAFADQAAPDVLRLLDNLGHACGVTINNSLSHERLQTLVAVDPPDGHLQPETGLDAEGPDDLLLKVDNALYES